jgi:hypothetical protein
MLNWVKLMDSQVNEGITETDLGAVLTTGPPIEPDLMFSVSLSVTPKVLNMLSKAALTAPL